MIIEIILAIIGGIVVGMILSKILYKRKVKKLNNPKKIVANLEKQEKEGKVFVAQGKQVDWRQKLLAQDKVDKHLEDLRQQESKRPYQSPQNLLPPPQSKNSHTSDSLKRMLGKK